ncbi:MAG: acyltransferase [Acidimicrobiia bacterium]|nr:acyltransferase [Acidimicrobiia bacterium]
MSRARREFPACDGLRALAALSVVFFHAAVLTGFNLRTHTGPYLFQLDVGVDVFFVLSGFLLYRPFVRAHLDGDRGPNVGRYVKRRFLRIFPAYWLVLLCVLYVMHQTAAPHAKDGIIFFSLTQIYSGQHIFGGLAPAWSLCTELTFYLFLPVYAWLVQRWRAGWPRLRVELLGVAALYVGSGVFRIVMSSRGYGLSNDWLPSYLDVFALGMLLAVVSVAVERGMAGEWWSLVPRDAAVWWAAALALFIAVSNLGMPMAIVDVSPAKYFTHHLLAGTIGALIVCPAVLHDNAGGLIRQVLSSRPLRALGVISYGIFLWHVPWIFQVEKWTGGHAYFADFWPVLLWAVVFTLLSAWFTYVLIERPLLTSRPRERGGSGVAAAIPSGTAAE